MVQALLKEIKDHGIFKQETLSCYRHGCEELQTLRDCQKQINEVEMQKNTWV